MKYLWILAIAGCTTSGFGRSAKMHGEINGENEWLILKVKRGKGIHSELIWRQLPDDPAVWENLKWSYGEVFGGPGKLVLQLKVAYRPRGWRWKYPPQTLLLELPDHTEWSELTTPELKGASVEERPIFCGSFPVRMLTSIPLEEGSIRIEDADDGRTYAVVDARFGPNKYGEEYDLRCSIPYKQ